MIIDIFFIIISAYSITYYFRPDAITISHVDTVVSIIFDLGVFTMMLTNIPNTYIILYLVAVNIFAGGVDILSALESKRTGSPHWRLKLSGGIVGVLIAIACIIFGKSQRVMVLIYCFGLINTAIFKIISAFRKTAIVYIQ